MNSRTRRLILTCILGLSLGALQVEPSQAQCGTDPNGGPLPCPEGEKERKERPTDIPATATFTPTPEPTATSTPVPSATHTPLPTASFTPASALILPPDSKTPGNSANPTVWLPLTGLALLLLLGLGYVLPRMRLPRTTDASGLELGGDIGGGSYQPGRGISVKSELEVEQDFTYRKDPVAVDLKSGERPSEVTHDPVAGVLDPIGEADVLADAGRGPLNLSGDPGSGDYHASGGLDLEGELDLQDDFDFRHDNRGATLDPGKVTLFNPDPITTRPTVNLELQEAEPASEPHRNPSRDGGSSGEADGEASDADAEDPEDEAAAS